VSTKGTTFGYQNKLWLALVPVVRLDILWVVHLSIVWELKSRGAVGEWNGTEKEACGYV
jgi:hypothetical protein